MEKEEKKKTVKKTVKKVVKKVVKNESEKKVVKPIEKETPVVVEKKKEPEIVRKVEKTNNNINFYLALIFFFLIIVIIFVGVKSCSKGSKYCSAKKAIEIGPYDIEEKVKIDTGEIISNKETYNKYFDKELDCELDFGNYNYYAISHPYDTCENKDLEIADFKLEGHNLTVDFEFKIGTTDCQNKQTYYLIPMEKKAPVEGINLTYYEHIVD